MDCNISIVIATYRRHALLSRCVNALVAQTIRRPFEIVVVSDGPDNQLLSLAESWCVPKHVRLVLLSTDRKSGPAAARNLGWRSAKGELIVFTDDDCIPDTNLLTEYWNYYVDNKKQAVCMTGTVVVPISAVPSDNERNTSQLENAELVTANCAIPRHVLHVIGGFDERYKMAWREDSDLYFAILDHYVKVARVTSAIVTHPVRDAGWGVSLFNEKKNQFNALLHAKYPRYYQMLVNARPPWHYYAATASLLFGALLCAQSIWISAVFGTAWLLLTFRFAFLRLKGTSRAAGHVAEMLVTSAFIPVLSLFWAFYGYVKFRNVSYED